VDLIDQIRRIAERLEAGTDHIQTEEATKNAFVMPFIQALGYDVFNAYEVVPEFTADVATKKGEKVDYAIMVGGQPAILFEAKHITVQLGRKHADQLYRYFSVTDARIGVLTNGRIFQFYSDLEQPNRMDERPYLVVDLLDLRESQIAELKKISKSGYDLDKMLAAAHDLKYTRAVRAYFEQQYLEPDYEFVKFIAGQVHDGRVTAAVREQFQSVAKRALHQFVTDKINDRFQSAIVPESEAPESEPEPEAVGDEDGIVTTEEEMDAFRIVRAILRDTVDVSRVVARDVRSYFGVLLDDNNRKPICRFYFNSSKWYLGIFGEGKKESRIPITDLDQIYDFARDLRVAVKQYLD
jgi:predicted type IV restriction endonuclease